MENVPRWVHKVINHYTLELETRNGWEYVREIVEEEPVPVSDSVPILIPNGTGGGYVQSQGVTRYMPHRKVMFLVRRDENSLVVDLIVQRDKIAALCSDHEKALVKAVDEMKKLTDMQKSLELRLLQEKDHSSTVATSLQDSRNMINKLEGDIGKIRLAIGQKQMKDILGG